MVYIEKHGGRREIIKTNFKDDQAWKTRRKRYGPSGYEDVDVTWKKRRELYGPSGYKDPGVTWKHRRERYGPTGRKPKVKEEK